MFVHNVRSQCSLSMFISNVRSQCSFTMFVHNVRYQCSLPMFVHNVRSQCSLPMFVTNVHCNVHCQVCRLVDAFASKLHASCPPNKNVELGGRDMMKLFPHGITHFIRQGRRIDGGWHIAIERHQQIFSGRQHTSATRRKPNLRDSTISCFLSTVASVCRSERVNCTDTRRPSTICWTPW